MFTSPLLRSKLLRIAFIAGSLTASSSAVEIAGGLLIDLDAGDYDVSGGIWPQHSETGIQGSFAKLPAGTPRLQTIGGKLAVVLDGDDDYLTGPLTTPALYAAGAKSSVEYWVFQGQARAEETVISWSGRGAPNGSGAAFRYSAAAGSGAVGRWGGPDMGFAAPLLGGPELGKWHHIVATYDGTTERVYVDGVLNVSEAAALDTQDSKPFYVGTERLVDGTDSGRVRQYSGAISRIRVHSGVLTPDQILANYTAEAPEHPGIATVPLAHPPIHRWSFNETAGDAPEGTVIKDSIGGLTAVIRGQGAKLTGTQISLPGGLPATLPAYVDLPNGLISGREHLTLEFWATQTSTQAGSRMVSFGRSNIGEINSAGNATAFSGNDYLSLYANVNATTSMRFERVGGTVSNGLAYRQSDGAVTLNSQVHYAIVFDTDEKEWRLYRNGFLMETLPETQGPTTIGDVNNWLGRSEFGVDSGFNGSFDEFRVYNYALSESEIRGNTLAGPDTLTSSPATAYSWKPTTGGTFAFNTSSNWNNSSSFPEGSGVTANLVTDLTGNQTVELNTTATVGSLTLGDVDGSNSFKIAPGTGGILELSAATGLDATLTQSSTSAANEISAPVRLLSDVEVTNTSATEPLILSAGLLGSGEFSKSGSGDVDLVADNSSFGGSFTVHSGALSVGNGGTTGSLGAAAVNITAEGIMALNRSDAFTFHTPVSGEGTVRIVGSGQVTHAGGINSTGTIYVSPGSSLVNAAPMTTGFANIEGQLLSGPESTFVTGDLNVGNLETGFGSLILSGGTVDAAAIYAGKNPGTSGVIVQTGGVLNDRLGGGDCVIGGVPATASEAWGALRMTGGVLNTTSHFQIGGQGVGVMEVENATVNFNGGYPSIARYVNGTTSRGRGVMDVRSGGVVNQTAATTRITVGEKGNGALNVRNGGLVDITGGMLMISTATDQGQSDVNLLAGGTIATPFVQQTSSLAADQGRFNFNGGILKAKASRDDFMQNIDRVYVYPGGAIVDSNGFDVGIHEDIQDPTGQGVVSIPVTAGGSGYLAPPYLEVLGDGRGATAMATLKDGKISGIVVTNPGTGYTTAPTVNIVGGGAGSGLTVGTPVLAQNHFGSFRKIGAGSVAIYSISDFTGIAVVEAGDLLVNGSFITPGSQLNVNTAGTVGGYGQIGGSMVVDGTVDAGVLDQAFSADILTVAGDVTFHSGSALHVDIDDNQPFFNDCIQVGGKLNISGAALKVNPLATGANLPYTIARFGSLTGIFASIPAGVTVKYNPDSIQITAIANPYQAWIGGFFPGVSDQAVVGPDADPDGDGYSNAVEFALGGSPKDPGDRPKTYPMIATSGDASSAQALLLTIPVPANTPSFSADASPSVNIAGVSISVEGSLNLTNFDSPVSSIAPVTTNLPVVPSGYQYRTFRLDASAGLPGKGFMHVVAGKQP